MRDTYDRLIRSASAISASVPYSPLSSSRCHRCARARALMSVLSILGGGAQSSQPGGATITLRPPWWRQAMGMNTVMVLPSGLSLTSLKPPSSPAPGGAVLDNAADAVDPQADLQTVKPDNHPLDQQLEDARLLAWEELVPQRIEPLQRLDHLALFDLVVLKVGGAPRDPAQTLKA